MLKILDALPDMPRNYNSELSKEILAFWENDNALYVEFPAERYASTSVAACTAKHSISRMKLDIRVMQRNGRVFLVKGGAAC